MWIKTEKVTTMPAKKNVKKTPKKAPTPRKTRTRAPRKQQEQLPEEDGLGQGRLVAPLLNSQILYAFNVMQGNITALSEALKNTQISSTVKSQLEEKLSLQLGIFGRACLEGFARWTPAAEEDEAKVPAAGPSAPPAHAPLPPAGGVAPLPPSPSNEHSPPPGAWPVLPSR